MNYFISGTFGFILLFLSTIIVGQQQYEVPEGYILTEGNNTYHINGTRLNYKELSYLYMHTPELKVLTQKVKEQRSLASVFTVLAVGSIVSGVIPLSNCELGCGIVLSIFLVAPISLGTIAIISRSAAKRNKRKSVDLFNRQKHAKENDLSFEFGSTQNGVGFVIRF